MTDVKKTNSTAKKNYHNSNNSNKTNTKKDYSREKKNYSSDKRTYSREKKHYDRNEVEEAVKIRKVEFVSKDETEEEEDKKLIIIIALSILVIIGTVIGLLVGCTQEETSEPIQSEEQEEDVVVDVDDTESNVLEEEESTVATKTTTKVTKTSTTEEEKERFDVIYWYDSNYHYDNFEEGSKISEYVPVGYNTCKYYSDIDMTKEYDFNNEISEDTTLYLDCTAIKYNVKYVFNEQLASNTKYNEETELEEVINPSEFSGNDTILLQNLNTNSVFLGWYLSYDKETDTYSNRVYALSRNLYKYVVDGELTLYGKVQENIKVTYSTKDGQNTNEVILRNTDTYVLEDNIFDLEDFVGWTTDKESNKLVNAVMNLEGNVTLYAVCADAVVTYVTETDTVTVAYTEAELLDENFDLPTPSDLGMEVTTYVIPVSEKTETSKVVVSEDDVEINTEEEISLIEAQNKVADGYEVKLGDNVEEKEKEFTGWKESDGTFNENDEMNTEEEVTNTKDVVETLTESENNPAEEILVSEEVINETSVVEG